MYFHTQAPARIISLQYHGQRRRFASTTKHNRFVLTPPNSLTYPCCQRGVTWVRVATAPSIPTWEQSFGYEEGEHGELVMQRPPRVGHTGRGLDTVQSKICIRCVLIGRLDTTLHHPGWSWPVRRRPSLQNGLAEFVAKRYQLWCIPDTARSGTAVNHPRPRSRFLPWSCCVEQCPTVVVACAEKYVYELLLL